MTNTVKRSFLEWPFYTGFTVIGLLNLFCTDGFSQTCQYKKDGYDQYSKTCIKQPLSKRQKIGFQDQLSLNAGQMYCKMLQVEHSAILLTSIKLPFVIYIFVLSIFESLSKAFKQ